MFKVRSVPKYEFQRRINAFTENRPRIGLACFYGSGKTYMSLKWLESLYGTGKSVFPVLIFVPRKNLIHQWIDQFEFHTERDWEILALNDLKKVPLLANRYGAVVTYYDVLKNDKARMALEKFGFQAIINDESRSLAESRTKRYAKVEKFLRGIAYRANLVGLPITEDLLEIWAQNKLLDGGSRLGNSFWKFRHTYFMPGPPWRPYDWTPRPNAVLQVANLLKDVWISVTEAEVAAQLPPKIEQRIELELPPDVQKLYKEFKRAFSVTFEDGYQMETKWAMAKATKLHQMAQGFVYREQPDGTSSPYFLHEEKEDWIRENLPNLHAKGSLVIWAFYKETLSRLERLLYGFGYPFGMITTETPDDVQNQYKLDFQEGTRPILLISQSIGSAGLDLWKANQALYVNRGFSGEMNENSLRRIYRSGSEIHKCVWIYDLVTKHTPDQVVLDALAAKQDISQALIQYLSCGD